MKTKNVLKNAIKLEVMELQKSNNHEKYKTHK